MGNKAWTLGLNWKGKQAFDEAGDRTWYNATDTKFKLGEVRTAQELTFVRVFHCGHMVPLEKPALALELISKWLHDEPIVPPPPKPPVAKVSTDANEAQLMAQVLKHRKHMDKSTNAP